MTNIPAPGADLATDEQRQEILRPILSKTGMEQYLNGEPLTLYPDHIGRIIERAYIAAVPASEPVKRWPAWANGYLSGTVVSDFNGPKITLRFNTTAEAEAAFDAFIAMQEGIVAQPPAVAATAPVSGMPDLAELQLYNIDEILRGDRTLKYVKFYKAADVERLLNPQAQKDTKK